MEPSFGRQVALVFWAELVKTFKSIWGWLGTVMTKYGDQKMSVRSN